MSYRDAEDLIKELGELRRKSLEGGGVDRIRDQHSKGKLTARERLKELLDEGSFQELWWLSTTRSRYYEELGIDIAKVKYLGDGVVVGYGKIDGRAVYVFAQDFTVMGGSIGEVHGYKIARVIEMAVENQAPVIGLWDSGGARIQEGVASLHGAGLIFAANARASGVVPQVSVILGPCAGAASYSPALTDFIVMTKSAYMFITGPEVIKAATGLETTFEELGGSSVHAGMSGVAHFVTEDDVSALRLVRRILSYLPSSNADEPPFIDTGDPWDREDSELDSMIPTDPAKPYDVREVIARIVDNGEFLEVQAEYGRSCVIGFARIGGLVTGVVANQPMVNAGVIDIDASVKISRFVRFLDAFNIPIVTLVDTPGFMPGIDQEHGGIIRHGAKILYSYATATVPKITIVMRKAYGGAYIAMGSRSLGADVVYAWPTAEIAVMGPEGAVRVLYRKAAQQQADPERFLQDKLIEYRRLFANPYRAAELGYVDDAIAPRETRKKIYTALEAMSSKREEVIPRKHGNMPL